MPRTTGQAEPASLRIAVLGGRMGESVVIRTPTGRVGVIDAWSQGTPVHPEYRHPTLELLRTWGVDRVDAAMVSHPHADHYGGMHELLVAFQGRVGDVWMPFPRRKEVVPHLLERLRREEAGLADGDAKRAFRADRSAWLALDAWVQEEHGHGRLNRICTTPDRPVRALCDPGDDVEVWVLAPTDQALLDWEDGLHRDVVRWTGQHRTHPHHNRIASMVVVCWGEVVVLLTSDCEWRSIEEIAAVDALARRLERARVVKLPHHGSTTSVRSELWQLLPNAVDLVVTPFVQHGLPSGEALESVHQAGRRLAVAGARHRGAPRVLDVAQSPARPVGVVTYEWLDPVTSPRVTLDEAAHYWSP